MEFGQARQRQVTGCLPIVRDELAGSITNKVEDEIGRSQVVEQEWECLEMPSQENPYVLFVSSRRNLGMFVLPKGGVRKAECACRAAERETWEEAGIQGQCIRKIVHPNKKEISWFEFEVDKIYDRWPEETQRKRILVRAQSVKGHGMIHPKSKAVVKSWLDNKS